MNTTDKENQPIEGESVLVLSEPIKKPKRMSPGANDEAYIQAYLENPHLGKAHAYRVATGDNNPHHRQRAHDIHLRLQFEITERLRDKALGAASFGMNVLFELAEKSDSENVRAACASKLVDFGLKYSPPDTLKSRPSRTRKELEEQIRLTQQRIETARNGSVT